MCMEVMEGDEVVRLGAGGRLDRTALLIDASVRRLPLLFFSLSSFPSIHSNSNR